MAVTTSGLDRLGRPNKDMKSSFRQDYLYHLDVSWSEIYKLVL